MAEQQPEQNDTCPCGSHKRYSECCDQPNQSNNCSTKPPEELLQQAIRFHQAGLFSEAERDYRTVLTTQNTNVDALNLLGVLCHQTGRSEEGGGLIQSALQIDPQHFDAATNLGNILSAAGHIDAAIGCYEHALSLAPDYIVAHCNLGILLSKTGKFEAAAEHLRKATALQPGYIDAHFALGEALENNGKPAEAITEFARVLERAPRHSAARLNLADCFKKAGRIAEAINAYQSLIDDEPDNYIVRNNLGNLLREEMQLDAAEKLLRDALTLAPNHHELHGNLSAILIAQNRLVEAIEHLDIALKLAPNQAALHNNLSAALLSQGHLDSALSHIDTALQHAPEQAEIHFVRGLALLAQGNLKEGFGEYEWRWGCKTFRWPRIHNQIPRWHGEQLCGKTLLVHAEQGLGDTIQFIRYGRSLREKTGNSGKIIFESPSALVELLQDVPGFDEVVSSDDPTPQADLQISLLSLAHEFRTELASIPAYPRYLDARREDAETWAKFLQSNNAKKLKVGIAWAGNPDHQNDRNRSIGADLLLPLAKISDVTLISLQKGVGEEALQNSQIGEHVISTKGLLKNFTDTAALIDALDLVVAVDTSVAHLAGALGKETWLLLPYAADWRWLMDRGDSPWYPSMRLFRQKQTGHWEDVITEVQQALERIVQSTSD